MRPSNFAVVDTIDPQGEFTLVGSLLSMGCHLLLSRTWRRLCEVPPENLSEEERGYLSTLEEEALLVPDEVDEKYRARWFIRRALAPRDSYSVVVCPTLDCNLACIYCYERTPTKVKDGVALSHTQMSMETAKATVAWIQHITQSQGSKRFGLDWYGGEPMLCPDIVAFISKEIGSYCHEQGISVYLQITTNGTLLTRDALSELIDLTRPEMVSVQFTIDGPARIHNARRPMRRVYGGAGDSFDRSFHNLIEVAEIVRPSVRINIDKGNHHHVEELLRLFNNAGLKGRILPYFYPTKRCHRACDRYIFANDEIPTALAEAWETAHRMGYKGVMPYQMGLCADYHGRSITVAPDGSLYTCLGFVGVNSFAVGHVSSFRFNAHYLEHLNLNPWEKCIEQGCGLVTICAGGCRERAYEELGDWRALYCKPDVLRNAMRVFLRAAHREKITRYLADNSTSKSIASEP